MTKKPTYAELEKRVHELEDELEQCRQTQVDLAGDKKFFAEIFHKGPIATAVTSIKDGNIVKVNEAFVKQTSYQENEIIGIGRSYNKINLWAEPEKRKRMVKTLLENGSLQNFATKICTSSGEIRNCLFSANITKFNNEPHVISMASDITDFKFIE
ncbi:PAS domain S-box protein [Thermodesulfobacteriota bacterium]